MQSKIYRNDGDRIFGAFGRLFVGRFHVRPSVGALRDLHWQIAGHAEAVERTGLVLVSLDADVVPMLGARAREAMFDLLADPFPGVRAGAVVVESHGFRGKAIRAALLAASLKSPGCVPLKVTDSVRTAATYLAEQDGQCLGTLTPQDVLEGAAIFGAGAWSQERAA